MSKEVKWLSPMEGTPLHNASMMVLAADVDDSIYFP